jgi:hypothetical protein
MAQNDFNRPQPRGDAEMKNVAAESFGQGKPGKSSGRPRSPRFHRMSITAAENGFSLDHTVEKKSQRKNSDGGMDPMTDHVSKTAVFGHDHPISHHIKALHDHMVTLHDTDHDQE